MDIIIKDRTYTGTLKGLVLDWAGTAVDYGSVGPVSVFMEVFKQKKVAVTVEEARRFMGLMKKDHIRGMCSLPDVRERWKEIHGRLPDESDVQEMYEQMEPMMVSCIASHSDPIPGVIETLNSVRKKGIKIGSSTGYTRSMMDVLTVEAQKKGYAPDHMVCSSEVPAGRPSPWMCFKNAMALNIFPMEAFVKIGDTLSDIHEGLNAGMWTIGLTKSGNELGLPLSDVESMPANVLNEKLKTIRRRYMAEGAHYTAESTADILPILADINERLARGESPKVESPEHSAVQMDQITERMPS